MAAPQPSARFVRAVAAERAELERHRLRLANEARELREALARIEHGLAEIDERRGLLDRLAPADEPSDVVPPTPGALRGPAIRERAVQALLGSGRDAMHYRTWFELLSAEGAEIAGKDPLAVFLTQITRSPVVRKGARAGVYELDRQAPARLRQTLDRLQRELAAAASDRARRAQLSARISRTERALEEALRVLERASALA